MKATTYNNKDDTIIDRDSIPPNYVLEEVVRQQQEKILLATENQTQDDT